DVTYVFNPGDGRDSILEFFGTDEHFLFRGYFTPSMRRAIDLEGIPFVTHEPQLGGAFGETFAISLGSVAGGVDTIRFGAGIAPEHIRFGIDLGQPFRPYSWIFRHSSGAIAAGVRYAEQAAYLLEIGDG